MPGYNFTRYTGNVLLAARESAAALYHDRVGTEHIFPRANFALEGDIGRFRKLIAVKARLSDALLQ